MLVKKKKRILFIIKREYYVHIIIRVRRFIFLSVINYFAIGNAVRYNICYTENTLNEYYIRFTVGNYCLKFVLTVVTHFVFYNAF